LCVDTFHSCEGESSAVTATRATVRASGSLGKPSLQAPNSRNSSLLPMHRSDLRIVNNSGEVVTNNKTSDSPYNTEELPVTHPPLPHHHHHYQTKLSKKVKIAVLSFLISLCSTSFSRVYFQEIILEAFWLILPLLRLHQVMLSS